MATWVQAQAAEPSAECSEPPGGQGHGVQRCAAVHVAAARGGLTSPGLWKPGAWWGARDAAAGPGGRPAYTARTLGKGCISQRRTCTLSSSCSLPCAQAPATGSSARPFAPVASATMHQEMLMVRQHLRLPITAYGRPHAPAPDVPAPSSPNAAPPSAAAAPAPALMRCSAAMRACSLAKAASGGPETLGPGPDPDGRAVTSPAAVTERRLRRAAECG